MKNNYDFNTGKQGAIVNTGAKVKLSIRLDPNVLTWFKEQVEKAGGGNYQTLINQALQEYIANHGEPLENILRRVIREELHNGDAA
jgi:uncharacterized protein (DUF4415 family)